MKRMAVEKSMMSRDTSGVYSIQCMYAFIIKTGTRDWKVTFD